MALFVDLVALSNGLHGSVQMDSVALFSWIGWLRHHGILIKSAVLKDNLVRKFFKRTLFPGSKKVKESAKTDSLNQGKSLPKNGTPVAFLVEKTDYSNSLLFFINSIKGKVIIDYYKTNFPTG